MAREPLRTGSEMAEEFGIKPVQLAAYLRHYEGKGAPAAMIKSGANYGRSRANWYSPTSMREWWYALPFNVNASKRATSAALLTDEQAARDVLGVSPRTFAELIKKPWMPRPIVLGPRLRRWHRAELEAAIANMPRQEQQATEPAQLAIARSKRKAA